MRSFPFLSTAQYLAILRIALGLFLAAHGAIRIHAGTVGDFGGFLDSQGLPLGTALAWGITIYELVGGGLLVAGRFVRLVSAGFIVHQLMGIALVHAPIGWFVVGYTSGGMEYSALLVLGFLLTASTAQRSWPDRSCPIEHVPSNTLGRLTRGRPRARRTAARRCGRRGCRR